MISRSGTVGINEHRWKMSQAAQAVRPTERPLPGWWFGKKEEEDIPTPRQDRPSSDQARSRREILIVDDDAMVLETLSDLIHIRLPHVRVTTCLTAFAAVGLAAASDFDVIIVDLKMPQLNGMTLLTILRRQRPQTPIIMITGHGDVSQRAEALEAGAFDFFQKPLPRERFIARLEEALADRGPTSQGYPGQPKPIA